MKTKARGVNVRHGGLPLDTRLAEILPVLFYVATVTPFDARGRVDLARLRAHVLWLGTQGVNGFVPTGSTGEFLYLTDREREAIHRTVLDTARGLPVYPCTWDPSPATTQYLTDAAREQGASGVLLPPPLYYDLPDDLLEAWYRRLRDACQLPILAYHAPAHVPSAISTALYLRLRQDEVVVGMEDASGDIHRLQRLCDADPGAVFASDDRILARARRIRTLGGFVSAIGNVWPSFCARVYRKGESQLDDALADRVARLRKAGGIRAMKSLLRMGCRGPLVAPPDEALEGLPPTEAPR